MTKIYQHFYELEKLENLCEIIIGRTPSRNNKAYWDIENESIEWLSIADMGQGKYVFETKEHINHLAINECNCKIIPENTVLLSFKLSVGKVCITGKPMVTNEAIAALIIKNKENVNYEYLYWALRTIDFYSGVDRAAKGLTLNLPKLKSLDIPLAPRDVQEKIVSILNKADSIRKKRKETIKLADEFLRSTFLEMFGDPVKNPFNWNELPFKELAKDEDNAIRRGPFGSSLRKDMFVPEGYLVYEQYHALNNDFSYKRYFIDKNKFEELKAFKVQPGDFIISCSGVYLGKLAEVPQDSPIGVINQALLKITLDKSVINNKYFKFVFSYRGIQNRMFSSQRGSGIPNFPPMSVVNDFMFPIPPIELQNKFAEIVEKTEKLKEKYHQSLEESENLFNSLMQRAFKGEL